MEGSRREFLKSKLNPSKNLYTGEIPIKWEYDTGERKYIWRLKPIYMRFISKFDICQEYFFKDKAIRELVTREDFIINNSNDTIILTPGLEAYFDTCESKKYIDNLRIHMIQNFIINWDEYEHYKYLLWEDQYDHFTFNVTSDSSLNSDDWNKLSMSDETKTADIQLIYINNKTMSSLKEAERKNSTKIISNYIRTRIDIGLVNIIVFDGTEAQFKKLFEPYPIYGILRGCKFYNLCNYIKKYHTANINNSDNSSDGNGSTDNSKGKSSGKPINDVLNDGVQEIKEIVQTKYNPKNFTRQTVRR